MILMTHASLFYLKKITQDGVETDLSSPKACEKNRRKRRQPSILSQKDANYGNPLIAFLSYFAIS